MDDCRWCFEKIYCLYKNLMFQIDPLHSSCSKKLQYNGKSVLFRKSPLQMYLLYLMSNCNCCCEIVKFTESNCTAPKFTLKSGIVYNPSSKTFAILNEYLQRCCKIVKLTHSPWKNRISVSAFRHLTQYFSNKNYCN